MHLANAWSRATRLFSTHRARLRLCLRVTVAAVSALALAQLVAIPLHGLWAVLTAVVVTQLSVGGSLQATGEYVVGTLCGAIYASAIGFLVPHTPGVALAGVLALTVAPLAGAAALSPMFRVAPFTAVLVLMISTQLGEGPIELGLYRLLEVALGGTVAVAVSMLVFPERAHRLGIDAAGRILDRMAQVLPQLLAGFTRKLDLLAVSRLQDEIGDAVGGFQAVLAEAHSERQIAFMTEPDPAPLSRTLLRLRHDFVIIGRAAAKPLPDLVATRLADAIAHVAARASEFLSASARALAARRRPAPLAPVEAAMQAYDSEISALRKEGLTRSLSGGDLERLFALGFAFDQLHQNFIDLRRCVQEWAQAPHDGDGEPQLANVQRPATPGAPAVEVPADHGGICSGKMN